MTATSDTARVYVGTYGKYNNGSLEGEWLELDDYADKEEFLKACAALHKNEHDPEFMFQDYEGIPKGMISESHIDEKVWDWLALDDDDKEILEAYQSGIDSDGTIEQAREAYYGKYKDEEDFAYEFLESTGDLKALPQHLQYYFNYEMYARDLRANGDFLFVERDGRVIVFNTR